MRFASIALGAYLTLAVALAAVPAKGASGTTVFAAVMTPLYATAARTPVGTLTPGTPVTVSGPATNGLEPVTLHAWSQQGDDTTIVAAQGQRIVFAALNPHARAKILASTTDAYGNGWNQVEVSGYVATAALTPDQETVWTQAHALYSKRCSACHALHKPTEFTANQWPAILKTMTKNAALQPSQAALVTQYLQSHAKS